MTTYPDYPRTIEEWRSEKTEADKHPPERRKRKPSAAERTVPMPGFDLREQRDQMPPPKWDGWRK